MSISLPLVLLSGLVAIILGCIIRLWVRVRQQARQLDSAEKERQKQAQQLAILQESLRTMGRQIVEQERKLGELAEFSPAPLQTGTDTESILLMLDEGRSVAEIVEATGLDEVEITLLRQIRESRVAET